MKLVTFLSPGDITEARIGVMAGDGQTIVDLQAGHMAATGSSSSLFTNMLALLDGGERSLDTARRMVEFVTRHEAPAMVPLADVQLLSPVPQPRSIRDAMAFEKHVLQATQAVIRRRSRVAAGINDFVRRLRGRPLLGAPRAWYSQPLYYKGNPLTVVGPDAQIRWPSYTDQLDYELEFGIFIGRSGRDIPESRAREHIAGYAIYNDFSARDVQFDEMAGRLGPAKSKDFDTGNAIGPYLVTADEVPDPYSLPMTASVNGREWSRGTSAEMHWTFEQMIARISRDETVHPGEFIGSGTVGGGCGLELDRWLQPGDVIELSVDRLGTLRNTIGPRNGGGSPGSPCERRRLR
jgi:2-keto-4-pentenoate hydratase/2-oxohepta-3-ene-1,7-dioic acid hydratase in catechol pathway